MRQRWMIVVLLAVAMNADTQENMPKLKVSDTPLTAEQVAVYRAVLRDYLKGSNGTLNLADVTEPIDESDAACLEGISAGWIKEPAFVVHRIAPSVIADTKIVLVDPDRQQERVKENDPDNLIRKAFEDGQKVPDEQLDESVDRAIAGGLFQFSEIRFDKERRRAVVSYSFVCGGLCGHGNTLLLTRIGQTWRVAKRCGGWVS